LDGIATVADEAVEKIRELIALFESDRKLVGTSRGGSIYQQAALQSNLAVDDVTRKRIAIRILDAAEDCGATKPTVQRALDELIALGIAKEVTGKARGKVYVYAKHFEILNRDALERQIGRGTRARAL